MLLEMLEKEGLSISLESSMLKWFPFTVVSKFEESLLNL